jgi:glycosyltransferase involved in cell wall biosynthesis
VDDNSDDDKVNFDKFLSLGEQCIEVYFTKEGKGAGYARNVGLSHAQGKWLLFADADDFFVEHAFEYLFAEIDSPHDIIYYKVRSCDSDTYEPADRGEHLNQFVDNYINKAKDAEALIRYRRTEPVAKMIRSELIKKNNIRFDEVIASNDAMFSVLSGYFACSVTALDKETYCVTVRRGSIANTLNLESLTSRYIVALRCNEFLKKHKCNKYQSFIALYFLISSIKYGITPFCKFIVLAFHYKMNPFIGINQWIPKYFSHRKNLKNKTKYIIT